MYVQDRSITPTWERTRNGNVHAPKPAESTQADEEEEEDEDEDEEEEEDERALLWGLNSKGSFWNHFNDNLHKILFVTFAVMSVLILILLRNRSETAALLCIESASRGADRIPYPTADFRGIQFLVDKGPYAGVRAEKWIVLVVSGPPTIQVEELSKLEGWQLLAVGIYGVPTNWAVPGAIFLSLKQQKDLGYRIDNFIGDGSYARKNIGYLFAVQHGAKVIYDADESMSVIGSNLAEVFDTELSGTESRREPLIQYRMGENRSVVNPYIHFGQRSMWPRGFPIRQIAKEGLEVSYNEITRGKQFIQQGMVNGLPDVDAIFYNTRRSQKDPIEVVFDSAAPPVALPQGTMAPMNSINTLFHAPALWSLMLPISVSPKVSDIIRGYWAQRLVWEVGGMLALYPPTVHRVDTIKDVLPKDEKFLHKHVAKLIKFLVAWRSGKPSLFQKIVHLSYQMAEQGFWSAKEVDFTIAWLQDLLAVGYHQPRLLSIDLDRVTPFLYNTDHKTFLPSMFPSVYLGIHEYNALEKEMADWIKWRRFYGNIVLILECSSNQTVLGWRVLYSRLFKHVVVFSQRGNSELGVQNGSQKQPYEMVADVFDKYPHADGYLYMKDDVVFNYWNLASSNRNKLWSLQKVKTKPSDAWQVIGFKRSGPFWYLTYGVKKNIKAAVHALPARLLGNYRKSMDDLHFVYSSSDIFYIPRRYAADFKTLVSSIGVRMRLRHEIAVPLFFLALDRPSNYDQEAFKNVIYLSESTRYDPAKYYRKSGHIVHPWKATTESELVRIIEAMSMADPLLGSFVS